VNTTETRNQMTLETEELSSLPMAGRNMLALISLAPGVSGLGLAGGPGVSSGTPGTGVDNYSTETAVDVSVNGQGTVANMWIVDGLDVTSAIRQGVLNLTQPRRHSGNEHSGQHVFRGIWTREWPSSCANDKIWCGSIPRLGQRLFQLPINVCEIFLAWRGPPVQCIPQQQLLRSDWRSHHSPPPIFLLFCRRTATFLSI